jgi:hypothetical protein
MTLLNNLIHNDYLFIPLYIGMIGFIGHAWFTESTKVFTNVNTNVTTSPVSSWPYDWSGDRVTNASLIDQEIAQRQLLRFQNQTEYDEKLIENLRDIQQTSSSLLEKLE